MTLHEKLFAYFNHKFDNKMNDMLSEYKEKLLSNLQGNVLEIGSGTGGNLKYFKNCKVIGIEPNISSQKYLKQKAKKLGIDIKIKNEKAEKLSFKSNTFDYVISTLVLCTVEDLEKSLKEIKRVLKSTGEFIFIEHVISKKKSLKKIQRFLNPPWKKLGLGCHLTRDILYEIKKVFPEVKAKKFEIGGLTSSMIAGKAKLKK